MTENFIGKTCPFCKYPFEQKSEVVICDVCKIPHHESCCQENGGCTTYACYSVSASIIDHESSRAFPGVYAANEKITIDLQGKAEERLKCYAVSSN